MIRSRLVVTKETPLAPRGMVTAEHPLGAEVGIQILRRGGNAIDAAVATAFAMTVVEPFMSTIAGSGTMLLHLARRAETLAIDFNVCAPARAEPTMFRLAGGIAAALFPWPRVEDDANAFGARSVAVPGSVAGLTTALERYGTMELRDVLAPAIQLARDGVMPDWYLALATAEYIEELGAFPESARTYLRNGRAIYRAPRLDPGERVRYPELARSLTLIARDGADAFYRGGIAQAIDEHMKATGGLVTAEDLAAYRIGIEPPVWSRYRDLELAWSPGATGGVSGLEILNILDAFPAREVGWDTVVGLDTRANAVRRAFLDRFEYLGDPSRVKAPWDRLVSRDYARGMAADFRGGGRRRKSAAPGALPDTGGRRLRTAARRSNEDCTTHVCVIDRWRNMVSLTHTAVSLFGSRMVVPGTGILLNNGMLWFDPEPGKPNSIEAGKRALVNMTPALGFRDGEPHLTIGAPGGRKIISAVPLVIATLVDSTARGAGGSRRPAAGRALQTAVEAPRLHIEGDVLEVDDRVGERLLAALARRGYSVVPKEETYSSLSFAKPIAIRTSARGLEAGLDHLRPAAAAGY